MGAPETPNRPQKNRSPSVGLATIAGFGLLLAAMALWAFLNPPGDRNNVPYDRSWALRWGSVCRFGSLRRLSSGRICCPLPLGSRADIAARRGHAAHRRA